MRELPAQPSRDGAVVLGRFRLGRPVARGVAAVVYEGLDCGTGQRVAVKVLTDASRAERFAREARLLAALSHPGIVRYLGHGEEDGRTVLVMEWIDGESLAARLSRQPLPLAEAVAIGVALADALGALHSLGIVHRDVKPSNVMLEATSARLLDLGLAREDARAPLTGADEVLGTPGYMAPEQVRGRSRVDARADVFALGCVIYECIARRPAFPGGSVLGLLERILTEAPPHPSDVWSDVPRALGDLVLEMLAKRPVDRPANGAAVHARLVRIAADLGMADARSRTFATERRFATVLVAGGAGLDALSGRHDLAGARAQQGDDALAFTSGSAKEQALRAAEVAVEVLRRAPAARLAIAMGRTGDVDAPAAPVLERARALLASAPDARIAHVAAVDELAATLLGDRFVVEPFEGGAWLGAEPTGAPRTLLGRVTPFVGRDRELATLLACADETFDEPRASAALVLGEPGIGKSRLLAELRVRLEANGVLAVVARADPLAADASFGLSAQVIRELAAKTGSSLDPVLAELARGPRRSHRAAERDADVIERHLARRDAWSRLLGEASRARPLAVLLEDLHWGDEASIRLFEHALRELRSEPVFVVATARPELDAVHPTLFRDGSVERLRLRDLGRRATERLVREVLGESATRDEVDRLFSASGGHPFYLEELIRSVALGRRELPESVAAVALASIDALDARARTFVRAASVVGEAFWPDAVGEALGLAAERTDELCADLLRREVLVARVTTRFAPHRELVFRHAILRDAVYESTDESFRRHVHGSVARWLERAGERDAAVLALHLDRAALPDQAVRWYWDAVAQAYEALDPAAVVALSERAATLAKDTRLRARLRYFAAEALAWRGVVDGRQPLYLREATELLDRADPLWTAAHGGLCFSSVSHGLAVPEASVDGLLAAAPSDALPRALGACGMGLHGAGDHERARLVRERIEALPPTVDALERRGMPALLAAIEARVAGDPLRARREAAVAHEVFAALSRARDQPFAECELAVSGVALGLELDAETAERLEGAERLGFDLFVPVLAAAYAVSALLRGDVLEARRRLARAEVAAAAVDDLVLSPLAFALTAGARLDLGDLAEAESHAIVLSRSALPGCLAFVASLRLEIALRRGDLAGVRAQLAMTHQARASGLGFAFAEPRISGIIARALEALREPGAEAERADARRRARRVVAEATPHERETYLRLVERALATSSVAAST